MLCSWAQLGVTDETGCFPQSAENPRRGLEPGCSARSALTSVLRLPVPRRWLVASCPAAQKASESPVPRVLDTCPRALVLPGAAASSGHPFSRHQGGALAPQPESHSLGHFSEAALLRLPSGGQLRLLWEGSTAGCFRESRWPAGSGFRRSLTPFSVLSRMKWHRIYTHSYTHIYAHMPTRLLHMCAYICVCVCICVCMEEQCSIQNLPLIRPVSSVHQLSPHSVHRLCLSLSSMMSHFSPFL